MSVIHDVLVQNLRSVDRLVTGFAGVSRGESVTDCVRSNRERLAAVLLAAIGTT